MLQTVGAWMQGPCHGPGTDRRATFRFCASFSGRARKYQSVFVISIPAPRTGKQGQGRSRLMGAWEGGRALSWEVRGATGSICCPTSPIDAAPAALEEFPKSKGERIQKIYAPIPSLCVRLFAGLGSATATATATAELQASHLQLCHLLATPFLSTRGSNRALLLQNPHNRVPASNGSVMHRSTRYGHSFGLVSGYHVAHIVCPHSPSLMRVAPSKLVGGRVASCRRRRRRRRFC